MALRVWLPLNRDLRNHGLENAAVTNNGATFSDGCANFNGDSTNRYYMSFNDANFMNNYINHHSFSIGGWVKTTTTRDSWGIGNVIISLTYGVRLGVGSITAFSLYNSSRTILCNANTITNDDKWHHVMGTYDISDNKLRIYVDGVLKNTVSYTSGETYTSSWNNGNYIGVDPNSWSKDFCYYQGSLYDIRIYDHALSKKEVAEISRGCILHYPCNDILNESTVNYAPYPSKTGDVGAIGWDQSKHVGAILVNGWSSGYNSYVSEPSQGYHAMWNMIDGIPTIVFNDKNSEIGITHRWLGINSLDFRNYYSMSQGTTYTISFDAKSTVSGKCISGGFYYRKQGATSNNFNDGIFHKYVTTEWERYSVTFTVQYVVENTSNSFYFYGENPSSQPEGTSYVRNIQIEIKDHATPYTPISRPISLASTTWHSGWSNSGTATHNWDDTSIDTIPSTRTKVFSVTQTTDGEAAICIGKSDINLPSQSITASTWFYMSGDDIGNPIQPYIRSTKTDQSLGLLEYNGVASNISTWPKNTWIRLQKTITTEANGTSYYICAYTRKAGSKFAFNGWEIIKGANYLKDVSGFDNHSLITGNLPLVTTPKSARYDKCMNIDNSGTNNNYANCTIAAPQVKSASFWVYIGSSVPSGALFADYTSKLMFIRDQNNLFITSRGTSSDTIPCKFDISSFKQNSWNHFILNHLGTQTQLFMNGIELTNPTSDYYSCQGEGFYLGRRINEGTPLYWTGQLSDFRLFSRVLTQADVDNLYKDSLVIDKSQNGYCYELNESDAQSSVDVKKNGQLKCKNYSEDFDGLYLPAGTYVDTLLYYSTSDKCKAETYIKYDANGSGRDLMGFSGAGAGYWGVKADGTWEMHNSTYTDADITKYNKIIFNYPNTSEYGNYKVGTLGSSTGYSVRNKTIYHVKLWKNGVLERDLYPCSINNRCGLIDGLTGIFYPTNNTNSSLVPLDPEARIGKNGNVTFNEIKEI